MLTIFAWAIFVPSFAILLGVLWVMATEVSEGDWRCFRRLDNWVHLIALIIMTFGPGVYLFGW